MTSKDGIIRQMRINIRHLVDWKDQIVKDGFLAFLEAVLVLVISSLYLLVLSFHHGMTTTDVGIVDAIRYTIATTLNATETIIYVTGILSSTTAYFIVRLKSCAKHIKRIVTLLGLTGVAFWVATPLFMSGLQGEPANEAFATGVATVVAVAAALIWLYSLFSQRRIFERKVTIDGDRRGRELARRVEQVQ